MPGRCHQPAGWQHGRYWQKITELIEDGYRLIAPKRLAAQLGSDR